jgi:hypothetical protein
MIELDEMNNTLKKLLLDQMESITSIPDNRKRNNNTINLTKISNNNRSLSKYSDLSVGVVHYNMETFGEN